MICPPDHKHAEAGTCYVIHKCRCFPCRVENARRERWRNRQKAYGRYDNGLVDAAPVREHILALGEFGIGYKRVAELAGVGVTGVRSLIWGRQDPGDRYGEIPKRVAREKAAKILAVQATIDNLGDGAKVSALGAHRRIQALVTRGWSLSKVARRLDIQVANFWAMLSRGQVTAATHRRVAALYDELWNTAPPHDEWHDAAAYTRSVNYAKRRGWLPPLAWDDIDTDPTPEQGTVTQGKVTGEELLEDIDFLLAGGESPLQIAAIVGRKPGTIAKLAERHGARDIANVFGAIDRRAA